MKITSLDVFGCRLPLNVGIRVKDQVLDYRRLMLVRVRLNGHEGWGEVAPLPGFSAEDLDVAEECLVELLPRLMAPDFDDGARWMEACDDLLSGGVPSARFGLELALVNAWAAARGVTLREFLVPGAGPELSINALLGVAAEDGDAMADQIKAAGYRAVKIKVGRGAPAEEAARVRQLAARLGEGVGIRLDANRAWTMPDAVLFARGLTGLKIEYIEEPVKRAMEIPLFARETGLAVGLDETISDTPRSVWEQFEGIGALVVKPTILGGLARAHRLHTLAQSRSWRLVISSSFESGVGTRALCELAAAYAGPGCPAGLDTYRLIASDVVKPPLALSPALSLAAWPALAVDESRLVPLHHG
jgi:O-succinylbenzoate synthase